MKVYLVMCVVVDYKPLTLHGGSGAKTTFKLSNN